MKKFNLPLILAAVLITVTDLVIYQVCTEKKEYFDARPGYSFFWTLFVGVIGYTAWKRYPVKWPTALWLLTYTAYLLLLLTMIANRFVHLLPGAAIDFIQNVRSFPNSPMPLLILYFLATYMPVATAAVKQGTANAD